MADYRDPGGDRVPFAALYRSRQSGAIKVGKIEKPRNIRRNWKTDMQLEIVERAAKNSKDGNGYIIREDRISRPSRRDRDRDYISESCLIFFFLFFLILFLYNEKDNARRRLIAESTSVIGNISIVDSTCRGRT